MVSLQYIDGLITLMVIFLHSHNALNVSLTPCWELLNNKSSSVVHVHFHPDALPNPCFRLAYFFGLKSKLLLHQHRFQHRLPWSSNLLTEECSRFSCRMARLPIFCCTLTRNRLTREALVGRLWSSGLWDRSSHLRHCAICWPN